MLSRYNDEARAYSCYPNHLKSNNSNSNNNNNSNKHKRALYTVWICHIKETQAGSPPKALLAITGRISPEATVIILATFSARVLWRHHYNLQSVQRNVHVHQCMYM
jgi:hypothetical protein